MDARESLAALLDQVFAGILSAEDANQRIEQSTDYDEVWDGPQDHNYVFAALLQVALDQDAALADQSLASQVVSCRPRCRAFGPKPLRSEVRGPGRPRCRVGADSFGSSVTGPY